LPPPPPPAALPPPKPQPPDAPPPAGPPDAPPAPVEKVMVKVVSTPPGAFVYVPGRREPVGTTPCSVEIEKGRTTKILVRKRDFGDERIELDGSRAQVGVKLTAEGLHGLPQ
jgi:hypothetical protein